MGRALNDVKQMQRIYNTAKDVYEGKYSADFGLLVLRKKVNATEASLKMYFNIFSCMRNAKSYKMGTSEAFTKYLLNKIFEEYGENEYLKALTAVKGNYLYRKSVNNEQPGLIRACEESLRENGIHLTFDSIAAPNDYNQQKSVGAVQKKKDDSDEELMELNIQPAASILNVFSRLSYKAWYAIAEFVDNSTQSYISHESELEADANFEKLIVSVKYDTEANTLTIVDNAFGMEIDRFKDAILLDSKNESQAGRNEFGMGLKTAASWFGNVWHVTSTQYGSDNRYSATINIPELKELNLNSIQIHKGHAERDDHGTTVYIEKVTKKITGSRTIGKIRDLLSSMYRRDINNRNIEIWFNDEPIVFQEYPILTNFRGKSWKKPLGFVVDFDDKEYRVTGFVAIMNPGSFPKSGFALFRQDRVVIGGTDNNYKPTQIFGQAQSQKSLKLFGELNMNDFPVNQAKDGFIWDDGLEDAFIEALKSNIQEYIDIAELSIKERASETQFSEQASKDLEKSMEELLSHAFAEESNAEEQSGGPEDNKDANPDYNEYIDTVLNIETKEETISNVRTYKIPLSPAFTIDFSVQWARGNKAYWIEYTEEVQNSNRYNVLINIDHPFFMPFTKEEGFQKVLEKFALAFILAELQAKQSSGREGYIPVNVMKNCMNRFLEKLSEE